MLSPTSLTLVAALLPSAVLAQFVPPPSDLTSVKGGALGLPARYKKVPNGICETNPNVASYSGYVDVAQDQHMFFWFFEARNQDPATAPLTVYINGGPGESSMVGLFQETGPCRIDNNGNVVDNPFSWTNVSNMVFIDNPTQTGFSYSIPIPGYVDQTTGDIVELPNNLTCPDYAAGSCGTYSYPNISLTANTTPGAAPNFWKAVQGMMAALPKKYARNSINLATGSYGGHYGPVFSEYFATQNARKIAGARQITVDHLAIYGGWYHPKIQFGSYYNYSLNNPYDIYYLNDSTQEQMYQAMWGKGNCYDQQVDCNNRLIDEVCEQTDNFCYNEVELMFDNIAGRDEYDIRELNPDPFPSYSFVDYLNVPSVQKAIGAFTNFTQGNGNLGLGIVGTAFTDTGDDSRDDGVIAALQSLLKQGTRIMSYVGDADYNCNWIGNLAVSNEVNATGFSQAGFENITTSDGIVHGVVKQSGPYGFVRVYESGHQVPFYQPLTGLTLFSRLINGKDLATGNENAAAGYLSVGPAVSTYHEGNATVVWEVLDSDATYNTTTNMPNPSS